MRKTLIFIIALSFLYSSVAHSQTDAGVKILSQQGELYDNTKNLTNPYAVPLWGQKLGRKGFLLPYPIGITLNGYAANQDVTISNLAIGVNDSPMQSLDGIVEFDQVEANVQDVNIRTDLWVLPFLDVYGIFGKTWAQTQVGLSSIMNKPVDFSTEADFNGYVYGVGAMLTGGVRSMFFSLDASKMWTHFDEMKNNNSVVNVGLRTGYIFHYKGRPERNISVWTGATRIFLSSTTEGTINLSDIMPDVGDYQNADWYQALPPIKQTLVNELVTKAQSKDNELHYSLEKRPSKKWAMILGSQFQLDRNWQFRVESNFFGGRTSGLISTTYRFGILTKK